MASGPQHSPHQDGMKVPPAALPGRASSWLSTHLLSLSLYIIYNIGLSLSPFSLLNSVSLF